ncbi:hypothetical protein HTV13_18815 [Pseudomonas putida]|uniref:hypothetical protein n=1 Tax=Pseudomonas putida TaxID=303 RepID=UPI001571B011|nr:hypothetical protein [Pseudomonas putida]NSX21865.1 hypothetical protein [Pseudomonas putida]
MEKRTKYALIGTAVYILFFVSLTLIRRTEFVGLDLNELGDFLAGIFGPLALFWVVIGYFQQGEEVRNSTKELAHSVAELKRQSETARNRFEAEKNARREEQQRHKKSIMPVFNLKASEFADDNDVRVVHMEISNSGAQVRDVVCRVVDSGFEQVIYKSDLFEARQKKEFTNSWPLMHEKKQFENIDFVVEFVDSDFEPGTLIFNAKIETRGLTGARELKINPS